MKKKFIGTYNPSIILTYIGTFCSLLGVAALLSVESVMHFDTNTLTMILLIFAGVCDMFDGTIARMCKRTDVEKEFGIQLDSLSDTISFVLFPTTIMLHISGVTIISLLIACFYLFAGIMRLGWFNVTTEDNPGIFFGLPVTFAALIFPLMHAIYLVTNMSAHIYGYLIQSVMLLVAIAFILNFELKKPNTIMKVLMALIAVLTIIALCVM